jgi:hypothetical protein
MKKINIQKLYSPKWSSIFFGRFNTTKNYEINLQGLKGNAQQCWPLSPAPAAAWLVVTLTLEWGRPRCKQGHTVDGLPMQTNNCKTPSSLVTSKPTEFIPSGLEADNIPYLLSIPKQPRVKAFSDLNLEISLPCRALALFKQMVQFFFSYLLSTF